MLKTPGYKTHKQSNENRHKKAPQQQLMTFVKFQDLLINIVTSICLGENKSIFLLHTFNSL